MATYGYKVMELISTPPRSSHRIAFTEPSPDGLYQSVHAAARMAMVTGERDDRRGMYTHIRGVKNDAWGILLTMNGGAYGELRELVDVDDSTTPGRPVLPTDAVLSGFRILLIVPPHGDSGLIVSETRSRSHLATYALRKLNYELSAVGVKLRTEREITDAVAWTNYLDRDGVGVKGVELIQSTQAPDRTRFTRENVKRSRLQLDLVEGSTLKRRIGEILVGLTGRGHPSSPRFAGILGLSSDFSDTDFDEEKIIVVEDGKERKIDVTGAWPTFTYTFDGDQPPSDSEFVDQVTEVARDMLTHLNVDLEANWRPTIND